jgi:hypothetical protein
VLAYQYLQTLPQLAQAQGNTFWVIPSEVTTALKTLSGAFSGPEGGSQAPGPRADSPVERTLPTPVEGALPAPAEGALPAPVERILPAPPTPNGTVDNH